MPSRAEYVDGSHREDSRTNRSGFPVVGAATGKRPQTWITEDPQMGIRNSWAQTVRHRLPHTTGSGSSTDVSVRTPPLRISPVRVYMDSKSCSDGTLSGANELLKSPVRVIDAPRGLAVTRLFESFCATGDRNESSKTQTDISCREPSSTAVGERTVRRHMWPGNASHVIRPGRIVR